jgi:hypothetical protein
VRYLNNGPFEAGHAVINGDLPASSCDSGAIFLSTDAHIGLP